MSTTNASTMLARAQAAQQAGDLQAAARDYQRVVALEPGHAGALNSLGVIALADGDAALAAAYHQRAAEADPRAAVLWINLAKAQRLMGDEAGERNSLAQALDAEPLNFMALVRLAQWHERRHEMADAAQRWSHAIKVAPPPNHRPPGMNELLEHGQGVVERWAVDYAASLSRELAPLRAAVAEEERRRFDACIGAVTGQRRLYQNQCEGLYYPFLPADEFFPRALFPWFARLEAATEAIRAEFLALLADGLPGFNPYVQMERGLPTNLWSELNHSTRWHTLHLHLHGVRQEAACARCPVTAETLDALPLADIPGRAPAAFFSILAPRTRIPPHSGVTNTRAIIHLPLVVPPSCGFRVGGETRAWREGEAFAFDDTIEHEAWNDSDELRAILIFDCWNPYLSEAEKQLLRAFFTTSDRSGRAAR